MKNKLFEEIEALCEGLVYISETDAPVSGFAVNRMVETLDVKSFLFAARKPPLTSVETRSFSTFFAPILASDETGRWQELKSLLENYLEETCVFFLKEDAENDTAYNVYIVGLYNGMILGCKSSGIAT